MNNYIPQSGRSSTVPSVADLDGYTFPAPDYYPGSAASYLSPETDEFGFDPPKTGYPKIESSYSPTNANDAAALAGWPGFERDEDEKHPLQPKAGLRAVPLLTQGLGLNAGAVSRFGQVTPPRSNSSNSADAPGEESNSSPRPTSATRKKPVKEELSTAAAGPSKSSRKRKPYRKSDAKSDTNASPADEEKRRMSLEKNRLAAAKCRINKKEKTEVLQRDSHEKAVQNAFLKETVVRMKEEIQHINALLIAHASSEGCKRPEELHKHLSQVGQDYFSHHHMGMEGQAYSTYASLARQMQQAAGQNFPVIPDPTHDPTLLNNPPLPEFNQSADFDVRTPQPGD